MVRSASSRSGASEEYTKSLEHLLLLHSSFCSGIVKRFFNDNSFHSILGPDQFSSKNAMSHQEIVYCLLPLPLYIVLSKISFVAVFEVVIFMALFCGVRGAAFRLVYCKGGFVRSYDKIERL